MKILSLHFKNVNSLAGEWNIRFDDPSFVRNHLFAISGPTGSGKTSILDAISLALYGKTPRQKNVADKQKVDGISEMIMTSGTGETFSEVEFESLGRRYQVKWSVHRSRNSPTGAIQNAEWKLLFFEKGQFVAHDDVYKKNEVGKKIEEVVGLNFDQFMRAVMLPQGGFDSFLKSSRDEKALILEKLSGQEIYRKISQEVFERNKKEKEKRDSIAKQLSDIQLLSESELRDMTAWMESAKNTKKTKTEEQKKYENLQSSLLALKKAEKECQELRSAFAELQSEKEKLKEVRQRLDRGNKAQEVKPVWDTLERTQMDYAQKCSQKEKLQKDIPLKEEDGRRLQSDLKKWSQEEEALQRENKNRDALRDKVSQWDAEILNLKKSCQEKESEIADKKNRIKQISLKLESCKTRRAAVEKELDANLRYKKEHASHQALESEIAVIADRLQQWKTAQDNFEKANGSLETAKVQLDKLEKDYRIKVAEYKNAAAERDKSFSNDIHKIALFVQTSLRDGDTCPVCGNPFHLPHTEPVFAGEISATAARLNHLQSAYEKAKSAEELSLNEWNHGKENVLACEKNVQEKKLAVENILASVTEKLKPYGFAEKDLLQQQMVLCKLRQWITEWNNCILKIDNAKNQLNILDADEKSLAASMETENADLQNLEQNLLQQQKDLQERSLNREKLFGNKDVAADRQEYAAKIENLVCRKKELEKDYNQNLQLLTSLKSQLQMILEDLSKVEQEKNRLEEAFMAKLRECSFATKDDVIKAIVSEKDRQELLQKVEQVTAEYAAKSGQLQQAEKQLNELRSAETEQATLQTVASKLEILEKELKDLDSRIMETSNKLSVNRDAQKRAEEFLRQKEAQEKTFHIWDTLCKLIGSSDGKLFVNYVQQLTLKKLIVAANKHLCALAPRYKLKYDNSMNMGLYDAECGMARPVANLSGGESFLVSLSLALGLSSLASQRVRIDTLFLDEGFGSLDEKKLQKAIDVLRNLGESGDKQIGVISHVDLVKDGIPNHIEVIPVGNGRSRIVGAGVEEFKRQNLSA